MSVEWVGGMSPTLYFLDEQGNEIKSFEIGDSSFEELGVIFEENGFVPKIKKIDFGEPIVRVSFGGHYYELYTTPSLFEVAREFAQSKSFTMPSTNVEEKGYLLTIHSLEQQSFIQKLLQDNNIQNVWLGASDNENEGHWKWFNGPSAGTEFWTADTATAVDGQYVNWNQDEPNNAGDEDCATFSSTIGWNDVLCGSAGPKLSLLVEYGSTPLLVVDSSASSSIEEDNKAEL
eukprot:TRINITY_DN8821_c0_g1_i1.p1 TRINITY_DN8821_c0_g1~~TRINITY_DN8821_c0_g1_i1.p1  ORF type:complete len:232 (-),score=87.72 TRINITY_DN8821_c0_g1_i1:388-1083(-)